MANNGIFYTSGNTLDFTTTGTTWARLSSGGTFSSRGLSATTYYNLPQSVSGAGTTNYISKWTGATGLGDSTIYDDGSFIGFNITSPTHGELLSIQTSNKGITLDGTYIIETGNGSLAFATGYDYGPWGGSGEIAIGTRGPLINSTGSGNIGIGDRALFANTTGSNNIAIGGTNSLSFNDSGNNNVTIGNESMNQNIDGSDNVSVGGNSLYNNVSGNRNVAIGQESGYSNGGSSNVFIGRIAGYNHLGSNSIFIGENSDFPDTSQSYVLSIGNLVYGSISGRTIGINVTGQTNTLHVSASTNPVRFEGLQSSTDTRYLVSDGNGVVTYRNLPGSSASDCFGTFYTSAISGCSPVTILTPLNATEGLNVTGTTIIQSLSATSFSASSYQGNVVNQITAGSGISIDQSTGNVTITSTGGGGGISGSGTVNYIPKWTGTTGIGNSQIRDDGTYVGIGITPSSPNKLWVYTASASYGIRGDGVQSGIYGQGVLAGYGVFGSASSSIGVVGTSVGDTGTNIGVYGVGDINDSGSPTNIGGHFLAQNGGSNYSVHLQDGTESTGRFLKSVTSDGKANWADLPVSAITAGAGISVSNVSGNVTITNTGGGGGGLTFQQVQMVAFLSS